MKKFTLLAAASLVAVAAQAQFNVAPGTAPVLENGAKTVDYIILSDESIAAFEKAGAKVNYVGPAAELGRNLWVWEETFIGGDSSYPRVDFEEGDYISLVVSNKNWSGAGFAVDYNTDADPNFVGLDFTHFDMENTHFHCAYMTPTSNAPASVALIIMDNSNLGSPAKVALGDSFNDNGAIFPSVGAKLSDDWQGVDLTLADLKKMYPTFNPIFDAHWNGNLMSFLAGGVQGQSIALDAIYFYTTTDSGSVLAIADDAADFVVTGKTINVNGGAGIELYNLAGALVKKTNGTVLGMTDLNAGVYVARTGNKVQKVVVR